MTGVDPQWIPRSHPSLSPPLRPCYNFEGFGGGGARAIFITNNRYTKFSHVLSAMGQTYEELVEAINAALTAERMYDRRKKGG